jgi:hypothetical protein
MVAHCSIIQRAAVDKNVQLGCDALRAPINGRRSIDVIDSFEFWEWIRTNHDGSATRAITKTQVLVQRGFHPTSHVIRALAMLRDPHQNDSTLIDDSDVSLR